MAIEIRQWGIEFVKRIMPSMAKVAGLGLIGFLSYVLFVFVISMKVNSSFVIPYIATLIIMCLVVFVYIFYQVISQRAFEEGIMNTPIINCVFSVIFFIFVTILLFGFVYTVSSECNIPQIECGNANNFGKLIEFDKELGNYKDIVEQSPIDYKYDSLYFSGVTFFNLGYGDITPVGAPIRFIALLEAGLGLLTSALLIGAAVTVLLKKRKR